MGYRIRWSLNVWVYNIQKYREDAEQKYEMMEHLVNIIWTEFENVKD